MKEFGNNSKMILSKLHPDLRMLLNCYMSIAVVDVTLVCGVRTPKEQKKMFDKGLSTFDGYKKKSKHQPTVTGISLAVDFCIYTSQAEYKNKIRYNNNHLSFVAGSIIALAEYMFKLGMIKHRVRWGGDWDSDGIIALDHNLKDLCHLELI